MNKIILTAESELVDNVAREWLKSIETKLDALNERTKRHTRLIKELEKELKMLKNEK